MHVVQQLDMIRVLVFSLSCRAFFPRLLGRCPTRITPLPCCTQQRSYAKKGKPTALSIGEEEHSIVNLDRLNSSMEAAVKALKWDYANTIVTRVTIATLEHITVEMDEKSIPLRQLAQIGMSNQQMLVINMGSYPQAVEATVKAIKDSNTHLNPITESSVIKVPVPKVTKELRASLVKQAKAHAEKTKVGLRKVRQRGITEARKNKEQVSEDTIYRLEKHIQQLTDTHTKTVEELLKGKSAELMKS